MRIALDLLYCPFLLARFVTRVIKFIFSRFGLMKIDATKKLIDEHRVLTKQKAKERALAEKRAAKAGISAD